MLQSFDAVDIDDVTHGEAAVALIARKGFDVILCDYNLGYKRKDGQQARRETIQTNNLGVRLVEEGKREEAIAHFEKAAQNLGGQDRQCKRSRSICSFPRFLPLDRA